MDIAYGFVLMFLVGVLTAMIVLGYFLAKSLRKHVEEALKDATSEEQDIIRNKVVKAMFPPRFPRN